MEKVDREVRFQVKGIRGDGQVFHVGGYADAESAIEAADGVSGYDRLIVVDEWEWNREIGADAVGIEWDSDEF